jgi:isopentenyl-diphosphate delta-isomerase
VSASREEASREATRVILVDARDGEVGTEEKMRAHREGLRHRAFSTCVFDSRGLLLLQRRVRHKYHSGGLWSNTCCSHPRPGEHLLDAAHRRLREEMRFDCDLSARFAFVYKANLGNGVIEHEYDHVLVGRFDGDPTPDPNEVDAWTWKALDEVRHDLEIHPEAYTVWFKIVLRHVDERSGSDAFGAQGNIPSQRI